MDNKERLEKMVDECWREIWTGGGPNAYERFRSGIYDRIAAANLLAPEWISVNERLPQFYDSVLVYFCEDWNVGKPWKIGWAFFNSDGKFAYSDSIHSTVTHWQPLPAAPKDNHDE